MPESARAYIGYGGGRGRLPYRMKDDYGRERQNRPFKTAVLENEVLRATFLLKYGGRSRQVKTNVFCP